jgi:FlaA1/EpsC-like NDP-sugar epimerase
MSLRGKKILITGSVGTVGSELIQSLISQYGNNIKIIGIDKNENGVFHQKLLYREYKNIDIYVCDLNNKAMLRNYFENMNIIIHCAAMKHVILAEEAPNEAISNNIVCVQNIIEIANSINKIEKVLFTSSDKAVNPTNVMGTTKLLGERLFSIANYQSKSTVFSSTRFGNVVGSNGSVLEIFKSQLLKSKPITLTHIEMTRFIMSKKQAASLVLNSLDLMKGGEVFITKMPVIRIVDLAQAMVKIYKNRGNIRFSENNYPFDIIGSKPGEKLYEELMTEEEMSRASDIKDYFIVKSVLEKNINNFDKKNMSEVFGVYNSKNEEPLTINEIEKYLLSEKLL